MTDPIAPALIEELAALNAAVKSALKARRQWMDAHMADFAPHPIGTEVFRLDTGARLGTIAEHYRYHATNAGDSLYDDNMSIDYRFTNGDNTSRQMLSTAYSVGDAEQLAARLLARAGSLAPSQL